MVANMNQGFIGRNNPQVHLRLMHSLYEFQNIDGKNNFE